MHLHHPPYRLSLSREPFTFSLYRNDRPILTIAPHPEPVRDWQLDDQTAQIHFPSAKLTLTLTENTLSVHWQSKTSDLQSPISNRFPLTSPWFGLGQLLHQLWPLNKAMLAESPLITSDNGPTGLSCILTPALLSADGLALLVHSWPLSVGINQPPPDRRRHKWDLGPQQAPFDERPWADPGGVGDGHLTLAGPGLRYDVLLADDLPGAHRRLIERLGKPTGTPPAELFTRPTWTTWARYKTQINQHVVLNFAREISARGYPYHVLEIDDRWQARYGDLGFDLARFPDPRGMVDELHRLGFKVTAWVIPFLEPASQAFAEGAARGYLVRTPGGEPYLVPWWQGRGGLLDVSHPEALAWFLARLRALQAETGLDGFKFDAGEGVFFPNDAVTHAPLTPNEYSHRYVSFVAEHFALCEVRTGWFNQRAPIFFRQWDKTTNWSRANGLRSVIAGALSLALTGYPFVLPDMIGGNAYAEEADAELMIRWAQLNALLPAMQFSLAPWDYGEECDRLCREAAQLHQAYAVRIVRLAEEAARTGAPIIRPLSWLAPHDEQALLCDDEFLLGEDVLVAPVVEAGARSRDLYLPPGDWRDASTGETFRGPVKLANFPAPLSRLPVFERLGSTT
jgi:hypothetical protein